MSKQMNSYIDEFGAVCHKYFIVPYDGTFSWERGDSARETGTYYCAKPNNNFLIPITRAFYTEGGKSIFAMSRHKYSSVEWHRDPKEFSRDQWQGIMCGAIMVNHPVISRNLLAEQVEHIFTAQNGDLIIWEYNLYIRMFRAWYLWPLLLVLDLGLVVNAVIRCVKNKLDPDDVGDDINVTSMIYVATQVLPTPTSWLARMIYKTFHPGVQKAWDWYYRHQGNPPVNEAWRDIIKKYFT